MRGQGCWNCKNAKSAVEFWTARRQMALGRILEAALTSPEGENAQTVIEAKRRIEYTDLAVASGQLNRCDVGKDAKGNAVGELIANAFLCSQWSGRDGASLARIDGKLDLLPEELRSKIDGDDPVDGATLLKKLSKDEPS